MADEDVEIRLGLTGEQDTSRGLRRVAGDERQIGTEAERAGARARAMGATVKAAGKNAHDGLVLLSRGAKIGGAGLAALGLAGTKWGLSFNAQVESARERFRVFTDDVDGLTDAVKRIDMTSQFNFGDLAEQAALLGNFGVNAQQIPQLLQGIANAAAASGQGTQGLQRIALDLGQIQSAGKVTGDELRDLAQAGAPVNQVLRDTFNLSDKQMQNVGAQGLDATKFLQALTTEWNSGRMAGAAKRQLTTLGGQWQLFTGNAQKLTGAATHGLALGLERDVLPAANRAVEEITRIFGTEGLSNQEKLKRARVVIRQQLGPVADDLIQKIKDADIAGKLDHEFERAMDKIAVTAATQAPHVVGEFVNAWLGAGPWAKLASGAWLAHKFGLDKGALALLKGGGGAKGGSGGIGGRGATPLSPMYVWVVGEGMTSVLPGGPGAGAPGKTRPATTGERVRRGVGTGARTLGNALLIGAAYETYLSIGKELGIGQAGRVKPIDPNDPRYANARYSTKDLVAAGVMMPPGNYTTPNITVPVTVNVGDRHVAQAVARAKAKQLARGGG